MSDIFTTGRVVDLILGLIALEAILLVLYWRSTGRGVAPGDLLWNLLAGCGLLLALRSALVGAAWPWIALPLSLALLAHLADLQRRAKSVAGRNFAFMPSRQDQAREPHGQAE